MIEAKYIKAEDLSNLKTDENGNYLIPEGIKIFIEETVEEKIKKLKEELSKLNLNEPSVEELIEEGKANHQYFIDKQKSEMILKKLKELGA